MFPQNIQGILELIGWTSARAQRHLLTDDDGILRVKMQWDTEKCGLAQARLIWFSVTQVDLVGLAGTPKYLEINGEIANLTTKRSLLTTANRITAAGADAGAAMAANTSYYVYASNSQATFAPSSVRGSATAPTDGYLGAGNAINWRHVGWVHTDAAAYSMASLIHWPYFLVVVVINPPPPQHGLLLLLRQSIYCFLLDGL
jgi:hypothetical protein